MLERVRRARTLTAAVIVLGALTAPQAGRSEALESAGQETEAWRFSVTPYLYLPVSTTGTSTVAGGSVDLDLDVSQVLDMLNFAASGRFEAWKGDFGVMVDLYYVNLSIDGGFTAPPGRPPVALNVKSKTKQGWVSVLGGWRFAKGVTDKGRAWAFDATAGVRFNSLEQKIDASVDIGAAPGRQTSLGGTETWAEPVVGLRGAVQLSDRWTLGARAELGGFGVGGDDLQWLVLAGFDWRAWERTSIRFGWQFYGIDYSTERSDGTFAYDVFQTGPYVGMTFNF